ncbi:Pyrroline-5-carboxylate reductase 3 [Sarcoptes scabiei]|uniref:Pyrroline-5-carboxylate reductase 3 n=1 Tax=Sarcoptes scabiei TaxID=52283 RepID=A0A834RH83_SARSC|nr:Pyrroline-5-carboxylate reductase 3 [Sarcoptes scabiei]
MNFTNLIGFIGAGNIAQSLAKGFIRSGKIEPNQIYAAAPSNRNLPRFKELGCNVTNDNAQILSQFFEIKSRSVDRINFFLFVCVKPQIIAERKKDFWNFLLPLNQKLIEIQEDFFIVSVMAGWKLSSLRDQIESHLDLPRLKWLKFARALPNIACSLNVGVIGLFCPLESKILTDLLSLLGTCRTVQEGQLDAICGLTSSGIAFVFSIIQAMADGGVLVGLPREMSRELTLQTIKGACSLVDSGSNPISLRDEVCSPAGTTIEGIKVLEGGCLNHTLMEAIRAATDRSKNLGKSWEEL